MEKISNWVLLEIFSYLDINSLLESRVLNKRFSSTISNNSLWKAKFSSSRYKPSTYHSGAYFKFPKTSEIMNFSCINDPDKPPTFENMAYYFNILRNPQRIIKCAHSVSSEDYTQTIDKVLDYNTNEFWSSKPYDEDNTNEFAVFELTGICYVFTISFKTYRALYQGGPIYPPKRVKILIGNTPDEYFFSSDEFDVEINENYNTILVLPNIVKGKYVRIDFIEKVTREPGSEKYYTVLSFVEITGFPIEIEPNPNSLESIIKSENLKNIVSRHDEIQSPFLYSQINSVGLMNDFLLATSNLSCNEIKNYFVAVYEQKNEENDTKVYPTNLTADFYFDNKDYERAFEHYRRIYDFYGVFKCFIIMEKHTELKSFLSQTWYRVPNYAEILKIARKLGLEYEQKMKEVLKKE
ncbi:hypothetical protein SteCoe_34228 [Stentor coeruleus]|uniref:F-box domain-containing protein n=1 Tax=Stentor coeruleus TaxID=5963 RepID=A0A1R2AV79_9CILI|nr:hypothetical protein SteCoe_34228 [Stentor coeruleus]